MTDREIIENRFREIKEMEFIRSNREHNTGIGKTFEDYLGVIENNLSDSDFAGFEVKSQRALTGSFLTLFTKSPTGPRNANTILRDSYGEFYEDNAQLKRLHTSIFSNKFNSYMNRFRFKITNNKEEKKIQLEVKNINSDEIINNSVYWSYAVLEKAISKKLKSLFLVNADTKTEEGIEYFHYTKAVIYLNPTLEKLLTLIDDGKLMIDIRIGSYKSGKNKGKAHDHGTGFRIKATDLINLYDERIILD